MDKTHEATVTVTQGADEIRTLSAATQLIHVVEGCAWITVDSKDIVLASGEEAAITSNRNRVVIASLDKQPLTYNVR